MGKRAAQEVERMWSTTSAKNILDEMAAMIRFNDQCTTKYVLLCSRFKRWRPCAMMREVKARLGLCSSCS